ncbi:MAG: NAD+ synthetase, partial [Phycisphaerales bacterium]|nr:NAD+ synthetase [Phycisphaerales bacterium]
MNLRLAVGALNQTPLDWDGNLAHIRDAIARARALDARLLCLPELCITGYGCEDAFHAPDTWSTALDILDDLRRDTADMAVSVGLPLYVRGALFNVAALLVDGDVRGFVAKQSLAGDGLHYEPRWFKPWPKDVRDDAEVLGRRLPVGDLVFSLGGIRLAFEICEDAWGHDRPGRGHAQQGVDVIFNPSASHFAFGKTAVRERFIIDGARAFGCAYAYSNLLGNEAGRIIYDGDARIADHDAIVARAPRFSFEPVVVTAADVDLLEIRSRRARRDTYRPTLGRGENEIEIDWTVPQATMPLQRADPPDWTSQEEEFTRAVTLGLRDYMVKSRSRGFVVSLSGGADSSAIVTLVATMVDLGARALGLDRLASELGHAGAPTSADLVARLLTTAYQSTRQSSDTTRDAARTLAEAVGATHHEFDVQEIVDAYTSRIEHAIDRALDWSTDDLALQNVQARVRAPSVWFLANIEGKLLVSTSNR